MATVAATLPLFLFTVGLVRAGFELSVAHPEARRFADRGRPTTGEVFTAGGGRPTTGDVFTSGGGRRASAPRRSFAQISPEEPGLGGQLIELAGPVPDGKAVPLLCLDAERRCAGAASLAGELARWPFTGGMLLAGGMVVVAGAFRLAGRGARRRDADDGDPGGQPTVAG